MSGTADPPGAAVAVRAPVLRPPADGAERCADEDVLVWSADAAAVVTAAGRDHLLTPSLAVRIPAGLPFAVAPPVPGAAEPSRAELVRLGRPAVDGAGDTGWLGVGALLRELLLHLRDAPPGAVRDRAVAALHDAADPVLARELTVPAPADPRLAALLERLRAEPAAPHRLDDWADRLGVSPRTLSRLCADEIGVPFSQWRALVRVHVSLYPLAAGLGVAAVSRRVGYAATGAFIAAFRDALGVNPGRFARSPRLVAVR